LECDARVIYAYLKISFGEYPKAVRLLIIINPVSQFHAAGRDISSRLSELPLRGLTGCAIPRERHRPVAIIYWLQFYHLLSDVFGVIL